jgi:hypothetical protein
MSQANLFWTHATGDPTMLPCTHLVQQHPGGDVTTVPCTHGFKQAHSHDYVTVLGNRHKVPCIHLVPKHPNGDRITTPCIHFVQKHPGGDPGPNIPCMHPMFPSRFEFDGLLLFYTTDSIIQNSAISAMNRFRFLGINPIAPRPLHIFHRPPVGSGNNDDPFWSKYHPVEHAIQIMKRSPAQSADEKRETLFHELGHALLGHSIINHYAGGPHGLTEEVDETLAMSEGWAHFVALVLSKQETNPAPMYKGLNWEAMNISPNPKIEYCVGCCLWDLWDRVTESGQFADNVSLSFAELFKVYSPTLATLTNGPIVRNIYDFVDRLKKNNPNNDPLHQDIDNVVKRNVG